MNAAFPMLSTDQRAQVSTFPGFTGLIALGQVLGDGFNVEIEGSVHAAVASSIATRRINGSLIGLTGRSGGVVTTAIMGNLVYNLPLRLFDGRWQPYVGVGIGYSNVAFNNAGGGENATLSLPNANTYSGPVTVSLGNGNALAYQFLTGVIIPLAFAEKWDAILEYRLFNTARAGVSITATGPANALFNGLPASVQATRGFMVHENSLTAGLRYRF